MSTQNEAATINRSNRRSPTRKAQGESIVACVQALGAKPRTEVTFVHQLLVLHFRLRSKLRVVSAGIGISEANRMFDNAFPYKGSLAKVDTRLPAWSAIITLLSEYEGHVARNLYLDRLQKICSEVETYNSQWQKHSIEGMAR